MRIVKHWRWKAAKRKWFKKNIRSYACKWPFLILVYNNGSFNMTRRDLCSDKRFSMAIEIMQRSDTEGFFLAWKLCCKGLLDLKYKSYTNASTIQG